MGKAIVFIIIFLLLIGVLVFAYYKFEKPEKDKLKDVVYYTNLTIFAEDMEGDLIKTTYLVYLNGTLYDGALTDKYGGVRQVVTTGSEYIIKNENLPEQDYYTKEMKFYSNTPDKNNRIILELDEYGPLNITQKGLLGIDTTINVNLTENKSFHNLMYCLKYSELLIFVNANGMKMDTPVNGNYKCYETNRDLNPKNGYIIKIDYNTISPLTENDYIKLTFFDKDELKSQNYTKRQEYYVL